MTISRRTSAVSKYAHLARLLVRRRPQKEENAVKEARKLNIPIVAVVDTNCDPDLVDYVIPGNDDAIRAIQLFASIIADAVIEAKQGESFVAPQKDEEVVEAAPVVEETVVVEEKALSPEEALEKAIAEKEAQE